jgi:hypothetical protein
MCGGQVRFVSENIGYEIYQRLMTSNGKKYLPPGSNPPPSTPRVDALRKWLAVPLSDDSY